MIAEVIEKDSQGDLSIKCCNVIDNSFMKSLPSLPDGSKNKFGIQLAIL